jgi:hypothetical protein
MRHHIGKKVRSGDRRIDAACSGTKDKSWQPIPGLGGGTSNLDNKRRLGPTYYIDDML